jgi:hypothetical protein
VRLPHRPRKRLGAREELPRRLCPPSRAAVIGDRKSIRSSPDVRFPIKPGHDYPEFERVNRRARAPRHRREVRGSGEDREEARPAFAHDLGGSAISLWVVHIDGGRRGHAQREVEDPPPPRRGRLARRPRQGNCAQRARSNGLRGHRGVATELGLGRSGAEPSWFGRSGRPPRSVSTGFRPYARAGGPTARLGGDLGAEIPWAQLSKIAVALVFITASIRFALGAIHQLTGRAAWRTPPASSGSCFSHLPFTSRSPPSSRTRQGRTMLPLGRRMRGSLAVVGSLEEQMTHARTRACARPGTACIVRPGYAATFAILQTTPPRQANEGDV